MRRVAVAFAVVALACAWWLAGKAQAWNDELALADPPIAAHPPILDDPHTPRLARRVVLVIVDGLGAGEAHLPYLDELRARGASTEARVPYPTISRPNYVTLLTGVPPRDSGVRANRVDAPVRVDTLMDRARAAHLRVVAASDFGNLVSLFARGTDTLRVPTRELGDLLAPEPPVTWPADEVRRAPTLEALGPLLASLDAPLVPVLILDVDRAGHAHGVGDAYRTAARAVDATLRTAFATIDFARDAVIVTADHGHVAPGGHGGTEPEVSHVPLILAGAGVVPGAHARDARSIDVAPTAAALLGLPAPGHAEGRALVELLALSPEDAARRAATDAARAKTLADVTDVHGSGCSLAWLLAGVAALAALVAIVHRERRLGLVAGCVAFPAMFLVMVAMTRGELSPSYVPSLARTTQLGIAGAAGAIALQLAAMAVAVRRGTRWLPISVVGWAAALAILGAVRAFAAPPFYDVPSPFWMVAIPTLELAAAVAALASALSLLALAIRGQ